jgi:hypothetical protein
LKFEKIINIWWGEVFNIGRQVTERIKDDVFRVFRVGMHVEKKGQRDYRSLKKKGFRIIDLFYEIYKCLVFYLIFMKIGSIVAINMLSNNTSFHWIKMI